MNYDRPAPTYESRKREYNYARGQATAQALRDSLFRHAQQKAKEAQYYQRKQRGWDNDVRQLAAMRIAPGRTPARDAMQAQLNVLRSMGLMG
jgi:hypothetical protein